MESFLLDPGHVNPEVWKPEYEKLCAAPCPTPRWRASS